MSKSSFSGPVLSQGGFITGTDVLLPAVTTATLTIPNNTVDDNNTYNGRTVPLSRAAGIAVTLPTATGSQAVYRFLITTSITSNTTTIKVGAASDYMIGSISVAADTGSVFGAVGSTTVGTRSDTITLNGTTQGGVAGSVIEVRDAASGIWQVTGAALGSGVVATPFSATV